MFLSLSLSLIPIRASRPKEKENRSLAYDAKDSRLASGFVRISSAIYNNKLRDICLEFLRVNRPSLSSFRRVLVLHGRQLVTSLVNIYGDGPVSESESVSFARSECIRKFISRSPK